MRARHGANWFLPTASIPRLLDLLEQAVVLVLYTWLVMRLWPESVSAHGIPIILLLLSEGLVCVLLVVRRPTSNISLNFRDWFVAAGGTFLALLVTKGGHPVFLALGTYLLLAGTLIHVGAKLSLRRSFGLVAANRGIKVRGLYAVIRHPMYAGYMLCHLGFLLVSFSPWNAAIYAAVWSLLIARISAEERLLKRDPKYREYARHVPYRMVPGLF